MKEVEGRILGTMEEDDGKKEKMKDVAHAVGGEVEDKKNTGEGD